MPLFAGLRARLARQAQVKKVIKEEALKVAEKERLKQSIRVAKEKEKIKADKTIKGYKQRKSMGSRLMGIGKAIKERNAQRGVMATGRDVFSSGVSRDIYGGSSRDIFSTKEPVAERPKTVVIKIK